MGGASSLNLWPYAPGVYGRDALYRVWAQMEADQATRRAFWDEQGPTSGDLASFVKAFDGTNNVLLLIQQGARLIGCFWLTQIVRHQAFASMWVHSNFRGELTVEAATQSLEYSFETFGFRQLWSMTPWRNAGVLCQRMGYEEVAKLPQFCQDGTKFRNITIYRLTKDRWNHGHHLHEGKPPKRSV